MDLPLITIAIPVYNQPKLLRECLKSIHNQTFTCFCIEIVDDCSKEDYSSVLKDYDDLRIKYIRHEKNIGAVPNMLYCVYKSYITKYYMVFREDDVLHPQFLEIMINMMEKDDDLIFSCCNMEFFKKYEEINHKTAKNYNFLYCNAVELTQKIVEGNPISWGSVIYRSGFKYPSFDFETYSVMGDRPFLINSLDHRNCLLMLTPLISAFGHYGPDNRWKSLKIKHILNLNRFYFRILMNSRSYKHKQIRKWITIQMFSHYKLLKKQNPIAFFGLFFNAFYFKFISMKYFILQFNRIRHLIEKCKL